MGNYQLFTTAKRHNSTLVPTSGIDADLALKQGQSLIKPTFLLNFNSRPTASMLQYEGRYYFINDIRAMRTGLWELDCEVDPLSTYKTEILATSAFVLYDTTANTEIIDKRLSVNTSGSVAKSTDSSGSMFETGCVILGAVGEHNTGMFAISVSTMHKIINSIYTNYLNKNDMLPIPSGGFNFADWDDAVNAVINNLTVGIRQLIATGKAPDSIKSCIYVACPASLFTGSTEEIWLGSFDTDETGLLLDPTSRAVETHTISIPWQFSDWRRNAPYTYIYLKLPYVGLVPISVSQIMGKTSFNITTFVTQNGAVSHLVYASGGGGEQLYIGRYGGNCASNLLIGASGLNPLSEIVGAGAITGASFAASMGATLPAVMAAGTAAIAGFMGALDPLTATAGAGGGGAYTDDPIYSCYVVTHNTNVDPSSVSTVMGTPTMVTKSLAGLSGYVETRNFSVSGNMTDTERDMINRLMDGGVYIE